jgi:hypothetical protein
MTCYRDSFTLLLLFIYLLKFCFMVFAWQTQSMIQVMQLISTLLYWRPESRVIGLLVSELCETYERTSHGNDATEGESGEIQVFAEPTGRAAR